MCCTENDPAWYTDILAGTGQDARAPERSTVEVRANSQGTIKCSVRTCPRCIGILQNRELTFLFPRFQATKNARVTAHFSKALQETFRRIATCLLIHVIPFPGTFPVGKSEHKIDED